MKAPTPADEHARLEALRQCEALDTAAEDAYDEIIRLAAFICGTPIAAVSLVDADRQFFKSALGLGVRETARDLSFCAHAVLEPDALLIVPDAALDPRFAENALVTGDPHIRFYAGAPLVTEDGHALGSLCVIDRVPRTLSAEQEAALRVLARLASMQLEEARRQAAQDRLIAERDRLAAIVEHSDDNIVSLDLTGRITSWNGGAERASGLSAAAMIGRHVSALAPPGQEAVVAAEVAADLASLGRGEVIAPREITRRRQDGGLHHLLLTVSPVRDVSGTLVGLSTIARDITRQKQDTAALAREREFSAAVLESLQEGIVACDGDGTLTLFNEASRTFHGLPVAPLPPAEWADHYDLYAADGLTPLPLAETPLFRALQGERVAGAEFVIAPAGGLPRTLLANGQAIYGPGGAKLGAVVAMHDVTERRGIERELNRLAAIVEFSEEAILAGTMDGTLTSWNAGAERLYGYSAAEVVGRHVSVLAPAGERRLVSDVIRLLADGGVQPPLEVRRQRKDGAWVDVSLSFSAIRDAAGVMVGLSCIARDISDRKRAERTLAESAAALAESEGRLRRLTDAAFEGIAVSQDGCIVDVNPAFAALFGCADPAEMAGTPVSLLVAMESRAEVLRRIAENDESLYEAVLQRRDGSAFRAEIRARITSLNGRPVRVTAVRDITVRKALEDGLRERTALLSTVLSTIPHQVFWKDADSVYLGCNDNFAKAAGLASPAEVVGKRDADLPWTAEETAGFVALDRQVIAEGRPVMNVEQKERLGDGRTITGLISKAPMRDAAGQIFGILGICHDITDRKQAEEALRESRARLAEAQRVADIGNWEHDLAGGTLTLSEQMYRIYDIDLAEAPATLSRVLACYHPDDLAMRTALTAQAMADGAPYEFDIRIVRRDGMVRWAHAIGRGERDATGRVVRLFGTLADVTERKSLELILRDQEARLAEAQRIAQVGSWEYDLTTGLSRWSAEMFRLLRCDPALGEPEYADAMALYHPDDVPGIEAAVARAVAGGGDWELDLRSAPQEGTPTRWFRGVGRAVTDVAGKVVRLTGTLADITERMRSEERFRVLFEQSSDAHMLVGGGGGGGIIDCNPAAVALLHCADKAELLGTYPAVLSPEFQPDGRRSREKGPEMEALAHRNGGHRFEWTHRRMDGEEFPAEITLTPVTLNGQSAMLAVWHDLTERKRAEQVIQDYNVVLEFQKQQLEEANAHLEDLATTDGLTGLKNHRAFQERLVDEVLRAGRYGPPLSMLLLDVDHFKQYNDAFGHPAGDGVLRRVAQILQECARTTDVVARYGGEEFVLILPQTDGAGAWVIAERIRQAIEAADWPGRPVTASLGLATFGLGVSDDGAALVARADAGLYAAKRAGRNQVAVAEEAIMAPLRAA